MNSAGKRLQELLDRVLDGTCTDLEQQEFTELLDRDRHLASDLVEQLRTHSFLQWQCGAVKSGILKNPTVPSPDVATNQAIHAGSFSPSGLLRYTAIRWRWAAAVLLTVAGGIGIWYGLHRDGDHHVVAKRNATPLPNIGASGSRERVAEIFDNRSVVWSGDNSALQDSGAVVPGHLEMKSGLLTLKFRSGATMSATGDVSLRIVSDMLVLLDRGQATAHVPQWAKGFTIKTRDVEVVDLGTQFGVMARDAGTTDVVVFEGQVDLRPTSGPADALKRLSQGEGVRVDSQGSMDRIVELRRDGTKGQWTTDLVTEDQPGWSETTFKSIRDNIPSVDVPTYYQITPHGLVDDCPAYTDATHEWNGLTSAGLPDFLRRADYVMTRNDYRYIKRFEMTVELARPATVFVLFDRRVPPPDWLTRQFQNTGVDIGLDEGPWKQGDTEHSVAVGGGQSIDTVFTVWSRRCEQPEILKFGNMGEVPGARAMYGIAAKPLD